MTLVFQGQETIILFLSNGLIKYIFNLNYLYSLQQFSYFNINIPTHQMEMLPFLLQILTIYQILCNVSTSLLPPKFGSSQISSPFLFIIIQNFQLYFHPVFDCIMHKSKKQQSQTDNNPSQSETNQEEEPMNSPSHQESDTQYTFGNSPISIKCPFCKNRTKTQIVMKPEVISIVFGLFLFSIIPNAVMIVIVMIVLQITATKRHRCSVCERQLGTDGKFLLFFTDQVYSFSLGENGILVSKKIIATILLFLCSGGITYIRSQMPDNIQWTDLTWQQLRENCPISKSSAQCNDPRLGFTVLNWKGYVMRVEDRRDSVRRYYNYALEVYIKMDPTEEDERTPDIYLTANSEKVYYISQVFDSLSHGDEVIFNATFTKPSKSLFQKAVNRHLHIVNMEKTGKRNENVHIYLTDPEQEYYEKNIEWKSLRKDSA